MRIIYEGYMGRPIRPIAEWDWETRTAVKTALELVEGKHGFRTPFETWRNCDLKITIGHNIYTTSIEIRPPEKAFLKHYNWHNGHAYYCNGIFWAGSSRIPVELI